MIPLKINLPTATLVLFLLVSQYAVGQASESISELLSNDEIRIRVWVVPGESLVPNQQIKLQIELKTMHRLAGGMKIGLFEIDDAIMMRREKFGLNSSFREAAQAWTSQRWSIAVYPRRSGKFTVPPIPLKLSIEADGKTVVGDTNTQAFTFDVEPLDIETRSVLNGQQWVATTGLKNALSIEGELDNLKPGDAAILKLELTAPNIPAMMLPRLKLPDIDAVAMYYKSPQLNDKSNRGVYQASSSQQITFVFEKPGTYKIDSQTLYWWNLSTETLETIDLELPTFVVVNNQGIESEISQSEPPATNNNRERLSYAAIGTASLFFLYLLVKGISRLRRKFILGKADKPTALTEADVQRHFYLACKRQQSEEALLWLYRWLDRQEATTEDKTIRAHLAAIKQDALLVEFALINQEIYATDTPAKLDLAAFGKRLMMASNASKRANLLAKYRIDLKLN